MTDIPDDIMKAARGIAAKACSESHLAQGKGSILAASPYDCALRAAGAAILAERERCAITGYRICAETRHVTLGNAVHAAIMKGADR